MSAWTGRLPQRPGLHPRRLLGPLRQGDRHQLGHVGAAARRRPGLRGAHDLHDAASRPGATEDARLIEAIATQASIAISTARLIEELDARAWSWPAAPRRSSRCSRSPPGSPRPASPGRSSSRSSTRPSGLVGGDGSILDLVDPGGNVLAGPTTRGSARCSPPRMLQLTIPIGVGASGMAVAEGRVIVACDGPDELFPPRHQRPLLRGHRLPLDDHRPDQRRVRARSARSRSTRPRPARSTTTTPRSSARSRTRPRSRSQNARLIEELGRSREEIARRADTEQSLREIAARITAIREPGDLLQHVVQEAARLLASDGAIIDLLDPVTGRIEWGYDSRRHRGAPRCAGARRSFGEDVVRRSLADRATLFTPDYLDDPRFGHTPTRTRRRGPSGSARWRSRRSSSERGALGTLDRLLRPAQPVRGCRRRPPRRPRRPGRDRDDERPPHRGAGAVADGARGPAERERSLRDIAARITSLRDPGEILARVVEESRRLLGSDGAHLTRLSDEGTYLVPVIVAGGMDDQTEDWLLGMRFPLGGGINGLAAEEVRPIWTYDYLIDPRIPHEPEDVVAAERLGLRAMAAAPLRAPAGEVIGTLAISYRTPREIAARRARPPPGPRRPGRDRAHELEPVRAARRVRGALPLPRPELAGPRLVDRRRTPGSRSCPTRASG